MPCCSAPGCLFRREEAEAVPVLKRERESIRETGDRQRPQAARLKGEDSVDSQQYSTPGTKRHQVILLIDITSDCYSVNQMPHQQTLTIGVKLEFPPLYQYPYLKLTEGTCNLKSSMETYSLLRVIGEGSFGRALLVQCKSTQEKYVVKEILLPKNQSKLESSRKEAILLSRMKHPNIVAFREAFEADALLCIVMEYCSGGDLLQRIRQQKTTQFCVDDILRWFAQMCAGAKHIHDRRVLHRDLKSKNIFLTENGTIKLGDFGSACILNSDVWSLGCVLYELCTLRHPFQASSWKSLILKVCRGAYPPLPSHLPYELHYLVKQMFKTNPKDRPSLHTILTTHRVSKLLHPHLPSQVIETEERGRRMGRWNRGEGKKVVDLLGEKSLIKTSTFEGRKKTLHPSTESAEGHFEIREPGQRKQWAAAPSDTVLQALANARLMSSDSMTSASQGLTGSTHGNVLEEPEESKPRRRWVKDPPERLLSLLEKVQLSRASSTFLINRAGDDLLMGPLSQPKGDAIDGPEPEVVIDEDRLEPRSDDEDTRLNSAEDEKLGKRRSIVWSVEIPHGEHADLKDDLWDFHCLEEKFSKQNVALVFLLSCEVVCNKNPVGRLPDSTSTHTVMHTILALRLVLSVLERKGCTMARKRSTLMQNSHRAELTTGNVNHHFVLQAAADPAWCRLEYLFSGVNEGDMADHTPPLESGQLLSPELPILGSPPPPAMVNGDGPQQ
ncbi:hypothetical protein INR49_021357, partial [Caranx melampygus]